MKSPGTDYPAGSQLKFLGVDIPTGLEIKSPEADSSSVEDPKVDKVDTDPEGAGN